VTAAVGWRYSGGGLRLPPLRQRRQRRATPAHILLLHQTSRRMRPVTECAHREARSDSDVRCFQERTVGGEMPPHPLVGTAPLPLY